MASDMHGYVNKHLERKAQNEFVALNELDPYGCGFVVLYQILFSQLDSRYLHSHHILPSHFNTIHNNSPNIITIIKILINIHSSLLLFIFFLLLLDIGQQYSFFFIILSVCFCQHQTSGSGLYGDLINCSCCYPQTSISSLSGYLINK